MLGVFRASDDVPLRNKYDWWSVTLNAVGINYELIAVKLGEAVKWHEYEKSIREIDQVGRATLKITKSDYSNPSITSTRAQTVYSWLKSLENSRLADAEKQKRLIEFICEMLPEEAPVRKDILKLAGLEKAQLRKPPGFSRVVSDPGLVDVLEGRWKEANLCIGNKAHLAAIVMMGSILEGVLLDKVCANPKPANQAQAAPKDDLFKPRPFPSWSLSDLINVAHECGWIQQDRKKFSHELRDYRNLVHPRHQLTAKFNPDEGTCAICWEVVLAAIDDLLK